MFLPLRDENPTSRFAWVTASLIGLNALIFFYQLFSPQGLQYFVLRMGAIPYEFSHGAFIRDVPRLPAPLTLLTSMFLHGGFLHLAGNMLYLWIFGNNIEDALGRSRFLLFYLLAGIAAGLTQIALTPNSQMPMIGASGAIAGVLGAYLLLYPRARIQTFVFLIIYIRILPIPAAVVLLIWFIGQILNIGLGGGVAWYAHIGGFITGMVLVKILGKREKE